MYYENLPSSLITPSSDGSSKGQTLSSGIRRKAAFEITKSKVTKSICEPSLARKIHIVQVTAVN